MKLISLLIFSLISFYPQTSKGNIINEQISMKYDQIFSEKINRE